MGKGPRRGACAVQVEAPITVVQATTVFGALRGLETFSQLLQRTTLFTVHATAISDAPRFRHRGLLLDTGRHYLPLPIIKKHLDAMAGVKFNVLHWHIVDDQGFPYVSKELPALSEYGAFSPDLVYTPTQVQEVIAYAKARGIRVIPEFDTPGHTASWGKGYPEVLTECYSQDGQKTGALGPLNPARNETYTFLWRLLREAAQVFPDTYVHLGGDEVPFDCWESNPEVQDWMKASHIASMAALEGYFEARVVKLASLAGRSYIVWQASRPAETALCRAGLSMAWLTRTACGHVQGYRALLSSPWYLNLGVFDGSDWLTYYNVEPLAWKGTRYQHDLVIGGEACMWGEKVDATNSIARTWPRAAAIAERLWSDASVRDPVDAEHRLKQHRCRMLARGINAEPLGPGFCPQDGHLF
eukprot:jgi/Astpho2/6265/e_gw1.00088.42.1_t